LPLPAASHLVPIERVLNDVSAGRTTFLMGQYSQHGWWYYFPIAFAIKTPLPTLILLLTAIMTIFKRCTRFAWLWDTVALVMFPLIYFASAMIQPFNIGYRHLLPILPFVFVLVGVQISSLKSHPSQRTEDRLSNHLVTLRLRSGQACQSSC